MCVSLRDLTTFGIGGNARSLVVADSRDKLIEYAPQGLLLGGGSNVLVSDDGYDGTVVLNRYNDVRIDGNTLYAGSGARLSAVSRLARDAGLSGMEWAAGIPGTVGGALVMNAGAFGHCMGDVVTSADVLCDGRAETRCREKLRFAYRSGIADGTVLGGAFELAPRAKADIDRDMRAYTAMRAAKQPSGKSAGSVFKNPENGSIARYIEAAGLKGRRVGGAQISDKHANFIINVGGATARDVKTLIDLVKRELNGIGVAAQEEIIYIGEFN